MKQELIDTLTNYHVPQPAVELIQSTSIVFLVGVAGAGKDTVIGELLKSGKFHYIISHTTRAPRHNHGILEINDLDYHFIDLDAAETMLNNQEFIEAKLVHGNIYGTSIAEIQTAKDKSEIAISEIEVQGIAEYRSVGDTVLPIFLLPPDFDTWQQRLAKRYSGAVDQAELTKRLETAKSELREALNKDYFEFVVNRDLGTTISIVNDIAHGNLSSEKNDQARQVAFELLQRLEATQA